jgi:hypothetical protein
MLEDIAIQYINQSEDRLKLIGYGLTILGAIVAGVMNKSEVEIARAPYFAYSALIVLAVYAVQIVWLETLGAMAGGYLWVLMIVSALASAVSGFFFGRIAMARSRDAYGHGRMAVLAFIPLANLWLLLTPSKHTMSANRTPTIPLLTGGLGVVSGFVMLIAAVAVTVFIEQEANRMVERAQTEPASQQAGIEFMIRSQGLEETLRLMAAESQTPITVNEVTTLAQIEADGSQLRRTYVVDLDLATISEEFRAESANGICAYGPFIPLLRAGATIREVYVEADGSPIGAVMVTREACGL